MKFFKSYLFLPIFFSSSLSFEKTHFFFPFIFLITPFRYLRFLSKQMHEAKAHSFSMGQERIENIRTIQSFANKDLESEKQVIYFHSLSCLPFSQTKAHSFSLRTLLSANLSFTLTQIWVFFFFPIFSLFSFLQLYFQ